MAYSIQGEVSQVYSVINTLFKIFLSIIPLSLFSRIGNLPIFFVVNTLFSLSSSTCMFDVFIRGLTFVLDLLYC